MKPVPYHSAECGEWYRPPGEPARSRGRPQRYTRLRNRECPRVSGGVTWKRHPGAKLAQLVLRCIRRRRGVAAHELRDA